MVVRCTQRVHLQQPLGGAVGLALVAALGGACGASLIREQIDIVSVLEVADVTTGWLDVGIDQLGRNKLVPTISFRLENISDEQTRALQLNSIFRRCQVVSDGQPAPVAPVSPADPIAGTCVAEDQEWGNAFVRAVGREGLAPGTGIGPFTMESGLGYTGEQPRREILQHRDFVDVKVELFVKHRADQWAKLGEHQIERQLLTQ